MNVNLPEKEKISKKTIYIYITLIIICIFAIVITISIQILGNDIINNIFGINNLAQRTEQEENALKANFENIFDNQSIDKEDYKFSKIESNLGIVYTGYERNEKNDSYEINTSLPYINIKSKEVEEFNQKMINIFQVKAEEVINNEEQNVIYTVKYKADMKNDILSVVIYSDLKQANDAQRMIVQTFCYDLKNDKQLFLNDILNIYNLKENDVQDKINKTIRKEQAKADELIKLGYNIFSRDKENEIYKINNINEFFIYENNIYIVFAYGNYNMTSEIDMVII